MGYGDADTNRINQRNVPGDVRPSAGPDGRQDAYEFGSIMGVSRSGRYKVFANPFTARPTVVATAINTAPTGTVVPRLMGTPALGSFKVGLTAIATGGSAQLGFIAFGAR